MVGHDWGGAVAWLVAMRHPELLEKLAIINSPHPAVFARELLNNPDQQKASQYMLMLRSAEAEQVFSENNFARLTDVLVQFGSKWEMSEEHRLKYIEAWSQPGALTGSLNYYRASPLYPPTSKSDEDQISTILNLPKEILAVKVPTLVIWGEQDRALLTGIVTVTKALDIENEGLNKTIASADFWEALVARQEKREPVFKGK